MLARGTSPAQDTDSATPVPHTTSRKRKRGPAHAAASPAPSDVGSTTGTQAGGTSTATDLLPTSRADLSSRPILSISRGPTFIPVAEGSEWFKTDSVGVNRIGYRYIPAGIRPQGFATPCRTIESNPTSFRISWEDRSPFLRVTKDGLALLGSKGFRSARANAPMREGKWYLEVKILHGGGDRVGDDNTSTEGSHVRLGWGRREASLNGPVGLDGYSYGYRDKTGEKVTLSRPKTYGKPFGTGDVVGMYISLPPKRKRNPKDPHDPAHLKRERIPIDLKGQEVFEILEYPQSKEMAALMDYSGKSATTTSVPSSKKPTNGKLPERSSGPPAPNKKPKAPLPPQLRNLPILPGSKIAFFLNGECQGTAFSDLYDYLPLRQTETQRKAKERHKRTREGVKEHRENPFDDGTLGYYPFISLFNDASVRLNPGPDFEYPPPDDIDAILDAMANGSNAPPPPERVVPVKQEPMNVCPPSPPRPPSQPVPKQEEVEPNLPQPSPTTATSGTLPVAPHASSSSRAWRAAVERYPEFMAEEWAFDAIEEEEAKKEVAKWAEADKLEEEKKKQREKKRLQAEARRKTKKEQQQGLGVAAAVTGAAPTPPPPGTTTTPSSFSVPPPSSASITALGLAGMTPSDRNTPTPTPTPIGSLDNSRRASPQSFLPLTHPQPIPLAGPGGGGNAFYTNFQLSTSLSNHPSPSPLRQTTTASSAYLDEDGSENANGKDAHSKPNLSSATSGRRSAPSGLSTTTTTTSTSTTAPYHVHHPTSTLSLSHHHPGVRQRAQSTTTNMDTDGDEADAEEIILTAQHLMDDDDPSRDHSPAPTHTSYGGGGGGGGGGAGGGGTGVQSGYTSEVGDLDDRDGEPELGEGDASEMDDEMDVDHAMQ